MPITRSAWASDFKSSSLATTAMIEMSCENTYLAASAIRTNSPDSMSIDTHHEESYMGFGAVGISSNRGECYIIEGDKSMSNVLKVAVAVSLVALMATPGSAQSSSSSTTSATTSIYQPISLANTALLKFGQIVKPATAGTNTVTVSAGGVRSLSGAGSAALAAGAVTAAAYTATGEGGQTFSISAASFNMASGANNLAVTPILSSATGAMSGAFGSAGTGTFTVGGSFPVADTTVSGAYAGNLVVTVAYN